MGSNLPEGFTLDAPAGGALPEGFKVDTPSLGEELMQLPYGANSSIANSLEATDTLGSAFGLDDLTAWVNKQLGLPGSKTPEEVRSKRDEFKRNRLVDVPGWLRDSPQPTTPLGRGMRYGGEILAESVPYAAAPYLAAARVPSSVAAQSQRIAGAPNALRGSGRALETGVANAPVKSAVGEAAATVGAGTGGAIARETMPDSMAAEVWGQVLGGLSPQAAMYLPSTLATKAAFALARRLNPKQASKVAAEKVAGDLGGELSREEMRGMDEVQRMRTAQDGVDGPDPIEGFEPSLAESTGSQHLIEKQTELESRMKGKELQLAQHRRQGNEAAIELYRRNVFADGEDSPSFVVDAAQGKIDDVRQGVSQAQTTASQRQEQLAAGLPRTDRSAEGVTIRDRFKSLKRAKTNEMSARADELGINDADVTVPFDAAKERITSSIDPRSILDYHGENVPKPYRFLKGLEKPEVEGVGFDVSGRQVATTGAGPTEVTFQDLKALREQLTDDIIDLGRYTGKNRRKLIRNFSLMREEVDEVIKDLTFDQDPDLAKNYRLFRKEYFDDYVKPFENGVAVKIMREQPGGMYVTRDEQVAEAWFKAGDVTSARQFKTVFGDDPAAREAVLGVAVDDFARKTVSDGTIDPAKAKKWIEDHRSVLSEFGYDFDDTRRAAELLADRNVTLAARARQVDRASLVKALESVEGGVITPREVMDRAVKNPVLMQQVYNAVRHDEAAQRALRRVVWESVSTGSLDDIAGHLARNRPSLETAGFTPKHLKTLERIYDARKMLGRVPKPRGTGKPVSSIGELEDIVGMRIPSALARMYAYQAGRTGKSWVIGEGLMRFVYGYDMRQVDNLYKEALYDPKAADDILDLIDNRKIKPEVAKRLNTRLFLLGHIPQEEREPRRTRANPYAIESRAQ